MEKQRAQDRTKWERGQLANRSDAGSSRNILLQQPASACSSTAVVPADAGNKANLHAAPAGTGNPRVSTVGEASSRSHPAPAAASTVASSHQPLSLSSLLLLNLNSL
ncbi:hypothetical protein PIB30_094091 [Stylosanthes scabra]|uniref:Uncharacterized protein n=1 Tax=Stylosanthes scabra TaxID=79078 RepID=A0ABU6UUU4_9FABA|nr:hypothetical protein [Stylosanthes scabra]